MTADGYESEDLLQRYRFFARGTTDAEFDYENRQFANKAAVVDFMCFPME